MIFFALMNVIHFLDLHCNVPNNAKFPIIATLEEEISINVQKEITVTDLLGLK